jgi:hypothetical protein
MGVIVGFLGMILLGLCVRWLGVEIGVHHSPVCHWLVRFAAAHLPAEERAAAESEWLAVIEDLRSPTAQLWHSLSFVVSALRIRRAIAPESRVSPFAATIMAAQLFMMGGVGGGIADTLFEARDRAAEILGYHFAISKPTAVIALYVFGMVTGAMAYINHRLLWWYFSRRARRRAGTPIE